MTKQEEIREGIKIRVDFYTKGVLADEILNYLYSQDVVIRSKFTVCDKLSLRVPGSVKRQYKLCYVEPLIGE